MSPFSVAVKNYWSQPLMLHVACFTSGMPVAAQNSEDTLWYRAEVMDLMPDGFLKVLFIDYGYDKVLHISKVHKLSTHFLGLSIQVRKIFYIKRSSAVCSSNS